MKNPFPGLLRPSIIFPVPAGMTPDKTGALGLIGFMSNANANALSLTSTATAGTDLTLTASAIVTGGVIRMNTGASGAFTITLPATARMLSLLGPSVPTDGSFQMPVVFMNNGVAQTGTVTAADAGTNVIGTATIATDTTRQFMLRVINSTISFTNIGSLTV